MLSELVKLFNNDVYSTCVYQENVTHKLLTNFGKIRYLSITTELLLKDVSDDVYFLIVESAIDPRFRKRSFNNPCTLHQKEIVH